MKIKREYPKVIVNEKGTKWLDNHPWLYESDVEITENHENGDIVDVFSPKNKYIGTGFISDSSKIRVRLFSRNATDSFDKEFFKRRLAYGYKYRKDVMGDSKCYRLIFGESDGLPGLTIDRFNDVLVTQIVSVGMERIKNLIFESLIEIMNENGEEINVIYERNDISARSLEGLREYKDYYYTKTDDYRAVKSTIINENGILYYVDFIEGQKTGFFLDQKYNRKLVSEITKDKTVLDCFTHTGSFALNSAYGGAKKVVAVDISQTAVDMAYKNACLNHLEDKIDFVKADVFDYLQNVNKKAFDVIILDPPAFTKSRSTINSAYNGYLAINSQAMKLLPKGGYLVSCSCSHFMNRELYEKMLIEASKKAGVSLKQVSFTQQSKDHPILMNVDETSYLKFYIMQIV